MLREYMLTYFKRNTNFKHLETIKSGLSPEFWQDKIKQDVKNGCEVQVDYEYDIKTKKVIVAKYCSCNSIDNSKIIIKLKK